MKKKLEYKENKGQLLIITGTQRSGNTLLAKLIGNHSLVKMEINPSLPTIFNSHDLLFKGARNDIIINKNSIKESIMTNMELWYPERLNNFDFSDWYPEILSDYINEKIRKRNHTFLAMKIPDYLNKLEKIELLMSNVKYINIIRDPRNVAYSQMSKINTSLEKALFGWKEAFFKASYYEVVLGKDKFHNVKYEDIILNPKNELIKICDFLGLNFEGGMLKLDDNETKGEESYILPYFDSSKLNLYKSNLSRTEIQKVEKFCYNEMKFLEYELENKTVIPQSITRLAIFKSEFLCKFKNLFKSNKKHMTNNKLKTVKVPIGFRVRSFLSLIADFLIPKGVMDIIFRNNTPFN